MEIFRSELRVGILVIAAVVFLSIGIFLVSDIRDLWEEKKTAVLIFENADGVTKGSPVWYSGYEVGEVSDIRIVHGETDQIAVTVEINPDARIRQDSEVRIRNLGMMGAKYVEISPGSPDSPELPEGGILQGKKPSSLSQIIEAGQKIAHKLEETIQEIHGLVLDVRGDLPIQRTFKNINDFVNELRQRGKDLEKVFQGADDLVRSTQKSIDGISASLTETSRNLNRTTKEGGTELVALLKEIRQTNRNLQGTLARLEQSITPVFAQAHDDLLEAKGLIQDTRSLVNVNDQNIFLLLLHLKEASRHVEALTEDLRAHPWKIIWKAKGTQDTRGTSGPAEWRERGRVGPREKE